MDVFGDGKFLGGGIAREGDSEVVVLLVFAHQKKKSDECFRGIVYYV